MYSKKRRRLTPEEIEKIVNYRRTGRSYTDISALMHGLPLSTIERYIKGKRKRVSSLTLAQEKSSTMSTLAGKSGAKSNFDSFLDGLVKVTRFNDALNRDYETPDEMVKAVLEAAGPMSEEWKKVFELKVRQQWPLRKLLRGLVPDPTEFFLNLLRGPKNAPLTSWHYDQIIAGLTVIIMRLNDIEPKVESADRRAFQIESRLSQIDSKLFQISMKQ